MSFSKNDLDTIKSKIQLSTEIGKKVKVCFRKLTDDIIFPCFKLV